MQAALIPHYRMDSFAFMSDAIVFCEEKDIQFKEIRHEKWTEVRTITKCKVLLTFKGTIKAESDLTIEYDSIFRRHLQFTQNDTIPSGRVLLFLKDGKDSGLYEVITAKLVQGDKVLQFGQFMSNPGPLVLAEQKPENIKLSKDQKYGEAQLLADLSIALKNAASLKTPVRMNAWDALK